MSCVNNEKFCLYTLIFSSIVPPMFRVFFHPCLPFFCKSLMYFLDMNCAMNGHSFNVCITLNILSMHCNILPIVCMHEPIYLCKFLPILYLLYIIPNTAECKCDQFFSFSYLNLSSSINCNILSCQQLIIHLNLFLFLHDAVN